MNKIFIKKNNSDMQSLWLLIPLFLFFLITLPIIIESRFSYNLEKNIGFFSIKLWFFTISTISFKIKGKYLIIRTKNDAKQVEISLIGPEIKLLEQLTVQIKDKVKVKKLEFHSNIGTNDALETALLSSLLSIIVGVLWGYIKNYKDTASVDIYTYPNYVEKNFLISLLARVSISIFDLIYSFIMASIILKKSDSKKGYVKVKK